MNENGIVFLHIFSLQSTGECIHYFSLIVYSLWKNIARFVWARFTIFARYVRHGVINLEDVNINFKVLIILFERSK